MKTTLSTGLTLTALLAAALLTASCASAPEAENKPDAVSGVSMVVDAGRVTPGELGLAAGGGKVLVVYFTTGNAAERVAKDLAAVYTDAGFTVDLERIIEKKSRNWGFMNGGFASSMKQATKIMEGAHDPSLYDRVFVLTPVWSWNMAPAVRSWLRRAKGTLPKASFATISGDTEPEKIVSRMAKEGGRAPDAYAGFSERDFLPENRGLYIEKFKYLVGSKQRENRH